MTRRKTVSIGLLVIGLAVLAWIVQPVTFEPFAPAPTRDVEESEVPIDPEDPSTLGGRLDSRSFATVGDEPAAAAAPARLRLHTVWEDTREPAPRIRLFLPELVQRCARTPAPFVVTDAEGVATLVEIEPGHLRVFPEGGGGMRATFPREGDADCEVLVPRGRRIRGRVVDPGGQAVPNAIILTTVADDATSPSFERATTGEDGRFELDLGGGRRVSAIAAGFGPSPLHDTDDLAPEESEIVLTLRKGGGALEGRVQDSRGDPVAGAWLVASTPSVTTVTGADGRPRSTAPVRMIVTDGDGRFQLESLPIGRIQLGVEAGTSAAWTGEAEIHEEHRSWIPIVLESGATVHGTVTSSAGHLVEGAVVMALGDRGPLAPLAPASSGPDGAFELHRIPPGEARLVAFHPSEGRATVGLQLAGKGRERWDARLDPGLTIRGRAINEDGSHRAGDLVHLVDPAGNSALVAGNVIRTVRTLEDGAFVIPNLPARPFRVELHASRDRTSQALIVREGVFPGAERLELVVPAERLLGATLSGAVIVEGWNGKPIWVEIISLAMALPRRARCSEVDGSFRIEHLPAGEYELNIPLPWNEKRRIASLRLEPGQHLELPSLRLPPPGVARIDLVVARDVPDGETLCRLVPRPSGPALEAVTTRMASGFRVELGAGVYELAIWREGAVPIQRTIEIASGVETSLAVPLVRAVPVRIHLPKSLTRTSDPEACVVVLHGGVTVASVTSSRRGHAEEVAMLLPVGKCVVELRAGGHVLAAATVEVLPPSGNDVQQFKLRAEDGKATENAHGR